MNHEFTALESEVVLAETLSVAQVGRVIVLRCGNLTVFLRGRD